MVEIFKNNDVGKRQNYFQKEQTQHGWKQGEKASVSIHVKCTWKLCCKEINNVQINPQLQIFGIKHESEIPTENMTNYIRYIQDE